jgi:hypothetical protein
MHAMILTSALHCMEVQGQLHALAALPLLPTELETECTHSQSKCFGKKKNFFPWKELKYNSLSVQIVARWLYSTVLPWHIQVCVLLYLSNLFTNCKLTCKDAITRFVDYSSYCTVWQVGTRPMKCPLLFHFSESHCYRTLTTRHILLNKGLEAENYIYYCHVCPL